MECSESAMWTSVDGSTHWEVTGKKIRKGLDVLWKQWWNKINSLRDQFIASPTATSPWCRVVPWSSLCGQGLRFPAPRKPRWGHVMKSHQQDVNRGQVCHFQTMTFKKWMWRFHLLFPHMGEGAIDGWHHKTHVPSQLVEEVTYQLGTSSLDLYKNKLISVVLSQWNVGI